MIFSKAQAKVTILGKALNAKIQAGRGDTTLLITRVALGMGASENPLNQTDVLNPLNFFVPIIRQVSHDNIAEIQIQLTNVGNPDKQIPPLSQPVTFQQIGFFAIDPDEGEILYRISQLDSIAFIPPATDFPYTTAPIYFFSTENAETVNIIVDPAGLVTVRMLAEHDKNPEAHENRFTDITQTINTINQNITTRMPQAPLTAVHGAMGQQWIELEGVAIQAVVMAFEEIPIKGTIPP